MYADSVLLSEPARPTGCLHEIELSAVTGPSPRALAPALHCHCHSPLPLPLTSSTQLNSTQPTQSPTAPRLLLLLILLPGCTSGCRSCRVARHEQNMPHVLRAMKSWRKSHALSCGCWPAQAVASAPVARPPPPAAGGTRRRASARTARGEEWQVPPCMPLYGAGSRSRSGPG
jgi:hypothetical protein